MPENTPPASAQEEPESIKSENFFKVYANNTQVEANPWDFRLTFGELTKSGDKLTIEQLVLVVISPQHAKALLGVLDSNLREYEKRIGQINLSKPEGAIEPPEPPMVAPAKK